MSDLFPSLASCCLVSFLVVVTRSRMARVLAIVLQLSESLFFFLEMLLCVYTSINGAISASAILREAIP